MNRPYINYSIGQLEELFDRASRQQDKGTLRQLKNELSRRTVPRAKKLLEKAERDLGSRSSGADKSTGPKPDPTSSTGTKGGNVGTPSGASKHRPTHEQSQAIDAFLKGGSLKINAYAGTGKTSTLQMLAHATARRGQYIAFNKDIVSDARSKFPESVNCSTTHGLAYRAAPSQYRASQEKMTGKINAHKLAELLNLKKSWRIDEQFALQPLSQGSLILKTLQRFTQSADREPLSTHVPRHGSLVAAPEATLKAVEDFAVRGARHLWERMQDPDDQIPLGHDGYLKLWALSDPIIAADYILLDEAQDTNPVVLDVLRRQSAQMIYVGDRYQQIYEWRGAVNAMEEIQTDFTSSLTKSFRFGETIASAASKVLAALGEDVAITGNEKIKSRIGATIPGTILARTNSNTITAVIEALDANRRPFLVGGNGDLMEMLKGVQDLKNGQPSAVPDFFGFNNWNEVVSFAKSGEGEHLLTFVNLVENRSERQLMWALNRTENDEKRSDLIISTAHKAKGREWSKVRLMDDFLKSRARRPEQPGEAKPQGPDPAELRLFYVALTRARNEVEVAPNVLQLLGLTADSVIPKRKRLHPEPSPENSTERQESGTRRRTEWTPPENWEPPKPITRPMTSDQAQPMKPQKKGFMSWLLGKSS